MEDAATAEISRSQVWQWVVSPKGILDDGRKVTEEMVRPMIAEELAKVKATVSAQGEDTATYDQAAVIFDKMSLTPDYPEFLTLPLVRSDGLIFVPAGVGIMVHLHRVTDEWLPLLLSLLISTVATLVVTALAMKLVMRSPGTAGGTP
jgi:hypothetical protein